jgi:ParB-like chromosome segregation protein Spo0J
MSLPEEKVTKDEILEEAYRIKYELAAKYGYDPKRIGEAIRKIEAESGRTYVNPPARKKKVI